MPRPTHAFFIGLASGSLIWIVIGMGIQAIYCQ